MPKRTDIHSVLIIAGLDIISHACEFDYSGTQAHNNALKEEGFRVALVNSNPATNAERNSYSASLAPRFQQRRDSTLRRATADYY